MGMSSCCGAFTTWGDGGMYCKKCFELCGYAPPRAVDALTFDEVEAAGLDGSLRRHPSNIDSKEYHFGVVATWVDSAWQFDATFINGDDSPFAEMSWGEVYDPEEGDVAEPGWQIARWGSDHPQEAGNHHNLERAIDEANRRLRGDPQ